MAIPNRDTLRLKILEYLSDSNAHTYKETLEALSQQFLLSEQERKQMIPSGLKPTFDTRVLWAISELRHAGFLENIEQQRGVFKITKSGLDVFGKKLSKIDTKFLIQSPYYKKWLDEIDAAKKILQQKEEGITPPTKGIIVLLDVLGMKGIWKREKPKDVSKRWNNFIKKFERQVNETLKDTTLKPEFHAFSDTIMITVKTLEIKTDLIRLTRSLYLPFITSIIIGMPLRGCIAVGEFHRDSTLIIGQAIDEAAEYYQVPQWVGISASPTTNKLIEEIYDSDQNALKGIFFKCDIPLKKSIEQNAWALRWPDDSDKTISDISRNKYKNTHHLVNERLKNAEGLDASLKWRNTWKFYELVIQEGSTKDQRKLSVVLRGSTIIDSATGNILKNQIDRNQEVRVGATLENIIDREQPYVFIMQIQDKNGVTVYNSLIMGSLAKKQSQTQSLSWQPEESGEYDVQIVVWERIDRPIPLSMPLRFNIIVV